MRVALECILCITRSYSVSWVCYFVFQTYLPNVKVHAYFAPVTPPPSVGGGRRRFCRCCAIVWSALICSVVVSCSCNSQRGAVRFPDFCHVAEVVQCHWIKFVFTIQLQENPAVSFCIDDRSTAVHGATVHTEHTLFFPITYVLYAYVILPYVDLVILWRKMNSEKNARLTQLFIFFLQSANRLKQSNK